MEACTASIPILDNAVCICRGIPRELVGKIHWIDWSLFCDDIDEALKPLRDPKPQSTSLWRFGRKRIKPRVLKKLQKVCDKQVKKQPVFQDIILYCPCESKKSTAVKNWHIQVIVNESSAASVSDVPANISIPSPSSSQPLCTRSAPFGLPFWPDLDETMETASSSAPFRLASASDPMQVSHTSSISSTGPSNPFHDDPNDSPAMSRDALFELDRVLDRDCWASTPCLGGDCRPDTLPIPMAPPAPFFKTS